MFHGGVHGLAHDPLSDPLDHGLNNFFYYYYYYYRDILSALDFVIVSKPVAGGTLDVQLINMSLGANALFDGDCDASTVCNMADASSVSTLRGMGVTVFASSGNNSSTASMGSPACLSEVVSLGAPMTLTTRLPSPTLTRPRNLLEFADAGAPFGNSRNFSGRSDSSRLRVRS